MLLRGGLQALLVGPDPGQRLGVEDIRDRHVRALGPERPRRLPPAGRLDPELLAEQGHEYLRLLRPEPRQRPHPLQQLGPGPRGPPDLRRVAVVLIHDQPRQVLHAGRHGPRVAVQGRPFGENTRERLWVEVGQLGGGGLVPEPADQVQRRAERALERHLLVEQHPDQQGERAAAQQLVGLGLHRHRDRHGTLPGVTITCQDRICPQRTRRAMVR